MSLRQQNAAKIAAKRKRRYTRAAIHRGLAMGAIGVAVAFLVFFFTDMITRGSSAMMHAEIQVDVTYTADKYDYESAVSPEKSRLVSNAWLRSLSKQVADNPALQAGATDTLWAIADSDVDKYMKFCDADSVVDDQEELLTRSILQIEKRQGELADQYESVNQQPPASFENELERTSEESQQVAKNNSLESIRLAQNNQAALLADNKAQLAQLDNATPEQIKALRSTCTGLSVDNIDMLQAMIDNGQVKQTFNTTFFTNSSSQAPEYAGIMSALIGSLMVLLITMAFAVPVGVMSAIYLEEYAPDNWFTRVIEININNLAAVPSIIFGLLGLAIFINLIGIGRNTAYVGGLTLGVMTLPVIIIATRAALRSVPEYIRIGAYGLGCTRWRVVRDHVLPLAIPGILTGSIIGLAQAMGETAPLIMIGLVANIAEVPGDFSQATTVMPAQIYKWSDSSDQSFKALTAAGILVLLTVLLTMNAIAVFMRRRFERRW